MANEILGREIPVTIDGTLIGVARTKSMTVNNEPVNVTSDGDDGIQRILAKPGEKSVEASVTFMFDSDDESLIDTALSQDCIVPISFDFGDYQREGDFFIASIGTTMEYNDAVSIDVSLQSTGAFIKVT